MSAVTPWLYFRIDGNVYHFELMKIVWSWGFILCLRKLLAMWEVQAIIEDLSIKSWDLIFGRTDEQGGIDDSEVVLLPDSLLAVQTGGELQHASFSSPQSLLIGMPTRLVDHWSEYYAGAGFRAPQKQLPYWSTAGITNRAGRITSKPVIARRYTDNVSYFNKVYSCLSSLVQATFPAIL